MEEPLFFIERHTPKEWHKFVDEIESLAGAFGYIRGLDEESAYRLAVSVREASINAIKHGNKNDSGKKISVDFYSSEDRIKVYVTDESDARFDPLSRFSAEGENILADHGRGLMVMKNFSDALEYDWLAPGNRVSIEKLKAAKQKEREEVTSI